MNNDSDTFELRMAGMDSNAKTINQLKLLGMMLIDNRYIDRTTLTKDDFPPQLRPVFCVARELRAQGIDVTPWSISEEVGRKMLLLSHDCVCSADVSVRDSKFYQKSMEDFIKHEGGKYEGSH
jgi:hypothetical protein